MADGDLSPVEPQALSHGPAEPVPLSYEAMRPRRHRWRAVITAATGLLSLAFGCVYLLVATIVFIESHALSWCELTTIGVALLCLWCAWLLFRETPRLWRGG